MVPARKHYGVPDVRAACGRLVRRVTIRKAHVTCQRCRETGDYRRGAFATGQWSL